MKESIKRLALLGLFGALVIIATAVLRFPVPTFNLYFNLGEAVIYLTALLFGGPAGAIVGGVGSALADILGGYPVWAPITLVIKGLEGYAVGSLAKRSSPSLSIALGALIMLVGYASVAGMLYGIGAVPVELMGDFVQVFVGGVIAVFLYRRLKDISFNDEDKY